MRILYLDCGMGAAGDMLTAALLELLPDKQAFLDELNALALPGVRFAAAAAEKCGISGTHMSVLVHGHEEHEHEHEHEHHEHGHHHGAAHSHSSLHDIGHIVEALPVSAKVKADILAVYSLIGEAESHVHGVPVTEIHFHEVGTLDAVADVTAVCLLMERLAPDQVVVSPVHVGCGQVKCAHGILPVPAPATAYLLQGVPIYGGEVKGELCTPTGAALLKHFATRFGDMPVMNTAAIGYGMGQKDFPAANCLRAFYGEAEGGGDAVVELTCNLDDMTAEAIGYAQQCFFDAGALEVYAVPAQMKKSRPGVLLSVICREADRDRMVRLIFKHTTTLGLRENVSRRHVLSRRTEKVRTAYGEVRRKLAEGYGVKRQKFEYEDLARIASEQGLALDEVARRIALPEKE